MRLLAALLSLSLAACATSHGLGSTWLGQPADQFFARHGPPTRSHTLGTGGATHYWRAESNIVGGPPVHCAVNITTDAKGAITQIDPVSDTIGKWRLSRCNEVLR